MRHIQASGISIPRADISIGKSRIKKYGGDKIYMDSGTEFEVELTNRTSYNYLAKIWVNDNPIGETGLVLRAGEHYFLDRFLDKKRKFLFETFKVDDVAEVREIIQNNGKVLIQFFKERVQYWPTYTISGTTTWYNGNRTYGNCYHDTHTTGTTLLCDNATPTISYTANVGSTGQCSTYVNQVEPPQKKSLLREASIETGRVERGGKSKQEFVTVDMKFESVCDMEYEYHILPISTRHLESIRVYCDECGRRQKKADKFCPGCGSRF